MSEQTSSAIRDKNRAEQFEQDTGRATRERTRLIVEGFSNLALIATFFAGVQAQLISVTNSGPGGNPGPVEVATNAAFFGGLIFSVFTAVLATLSARWFSILREDDADYLSSRWLSQDSEHDHPELLENYLDHQIESMERIKNRCRSTSRPNSQFTDMQHQSTNVRGFTPVEFDAECILRLLRKERGYGHLDLEKGGGQTQVETQDPTASPVKGASLADKPKMPSLSPLVRPIYARHTATGMGYTAVGSLHLHFGDSFHLRSATMWLLYQAQTQTCH